MANSLETKPSSGTTTWKLDPMHSTIGFSVKHLMITTVRGRFNTVDGTIQLNDQDFTKSSVEATIDAKSIDTGVEYRDNHLRSGDFFSTEETPNITFRSTRIERKRDDEYNVYGDLTIRGVTKPIVLDATFEGRGPGMDGVERISFSAKGEINRKDFGVNWNVALEGGGVTVSDKVKLDLEIQAVSPAAAVAGEADAEAAAAK